VAGGEVMRVGIGGDSGNIITLRVRVFERKIKVSVRGGHMPTVPFIPTLNVMPN
jgi:hypothetical protein